MQFSGGSDWYYVLVGPVGNGGVKIERKNDGRGYGNWCDFSRLAYDPQNCKKIIKAH